MIVEIGFLLAVITLFNLFPQLIGINRTPDAVTDPLPFIAPGFIEALPWMNVWWGLALALNIFTALFLAPSPKLLWARIFMNLLGLFVLLRLFFVGPIVAFNPAWLSLQTTEPKLIALMEKELAPALSLAVTISITGAIAALGYSTLAKARTLLLRLGLIPGKLDRRSRF
jgi:hypothetical protein